MVLPRITWLSFFADPTRQAFVIRQMLPKCFPDPASSPDTASVSDEDLRELMHRFDRARQLLTVALRSPEAGRLAWETLVRRAVAGSGEDAQEVYSRLAPGPAADAAKQAAEAFMHEMERWSIDLQRHCPSDWNQFSAVLLQCLSGGGVERGAKEETFTI